MEHAQQEWGEANSQEKRKGESSRHSGLGSRGVWADSPGESSEARPCACLLGTEPQGC